MANTSLKTSKYDFSLPPTRDSSKSRGSNNSTSSERDCYYYYVYRKKIDPSAIKGPDDLPVPLIFRRNNVEFRRLTGSLSDLRKDSAEDSNSPTSVAATGAVPNKKKLRERSNSLPNLYKGSPKYMQQGRKRSNKKLKPLKNAPLPNIQNNGRLTADTDVPETGTIKGGLSIPVLLNLTGKEGLQWSRHTTITRTPHGVSERTINIETRKVQRDGKWHEETTKTTTHTNEKGATTNSRKQDLRELTPDEIEQHLISLRDDPSEISPKGKAALPVAPLKKTEKIEKKKLKEVVKANKKPIQAVGKKPEVTKPKDDPESFAQQVLAAVNGYRRSHGVPPLTESEKLNKMAAEWANRLANLEKMEHGDKKGLGENIYCKTSSQPWFPLTGEEVVENWYNEVEDHNYDEEPNQGYLNTGHFTQLIWSDTKEMGVAFARNKNGHMAFVVSYFNPKGNWIGEFREKVPPPGGFLKGKIDNQPVKSALVAVSNKKTLPPIVSPPITADVSLKSKRSKKKWNEPPSLPPRNKPAIQTKKFDSSEESSPHQEFDDSPTPSLRNGTDRNNSMKSNRFLDDSPSLSSRNSTASSSNFKTKRLTETPSSNSTTSSRNSTAISSTSKRSRNSVASSLTNADIESPTTMSATFRQEFLTAHNKYRKKHGVKALRLSQKLNDFAQEWADDIAKVDRMEHRDDNEYGENIYAKWTSNQFYVMPGEEPVDSWYSEIDDYDFGQEPLDLSAGHFTQVIWADTEEVGVGLAKAKSEKIYVVANYDPPGNYVGQFSKMVPSPKY